MEELTHFILHPQSAFVLPSDIADYRIRYFTPKQEVPLCGHATMAAIYGLYESGRIDSGIITIETLEGVLEIEVIKNDDIHIIMQQGSYREIIFDGDRVSLAAAIGISEQDIDERYPIVYGSTGLWTLLIPIKSRKSFERMKPHNELFPEILKQNPRSSVHPFCLDTYHPECVMHARHFSSPFSGTVEDSVTGTASGVMGAYYKKYISNSMDKLTLRIEQGTEIGKDGIVEVIVPEDMRDPVKIIGTAVLSKR